MNEDQAATEYTINAHERSYRIRATGRIAKCAEAESPYEPQLLEHIYAQRFKGAAIDAGAHIGNHSLWFSAICGLKVHAFEPDETFDLLAENIALNDVDVTAHNFALSDRPGAASAIHNGCLQPGSGSIEVRTIDEFEFNEISLIKVDVEGMEASVLAGALQTIERCRPMIYAEAWSRSKARRVGEVLAPLGYVAEQTIPVATPVVEWGPR